MKKLLSLLLIMCCLSVSAQWQTITGTSQKDKATGAFRWNFGSFGLLYPYQKTTVDSLIATKVSTVATIADLQAYSGGATTFFVTDSLRGGEFHYYASGGGFTIDNGINFTATGKGGGVMHRVIKDKWVYPEWWGATPWSGTGSYVDARTSIQAAYDSSPNKASSVFIKYRFKYSGTLYIGQSTETEGSNVAFPKQYFGADSILYYIKNGLYHDNVGGQASIKTTQAVTSSRPQFPSFKNLAIIGSNKNLDTAIVFGNNPNSTAPLGRVGLALVENVYIDGFYTGIDCTNGGGDSFRSVRGHYSNLGGYGVRTGNAGESFGIQNDFFTIGVAGVELNGRNEVWQQTEMEVGSTSIGFLLNTAQRASISNNTFSDVKNAVYASSTSSRNVIKNNFINNSAGNAIVIDASLLTDVSNNTFQQGTEITNPAFNFIYARQTTSPFIKDNTFIRLGGAMTSPLRVDTCTLASLIDNQVYGFSPNNNTTFTISANTTFSQNNEYGNRSIVGDVNAVNSTFSGNERVAGVIDAGSGASTSAHVLRGGASGTTIFGLSRSSGVARRFNFSLGNGMSVTDSTRSTAPILSMYADVSTEQQIFSGSRAKTTGDTFQSTFAGTTFSGITNQAGNATNIVGQLGTGNGASANVNIYAAVPTTSGTTPQNRGLVASYGYASSFWNVSGVKALGITAVPATNSLLKVDGSNNIVVATGSDITALTGIIDTTTTAYTSATLNSTYASVPVMYQVWCRNVSGGGIVYTKQTEAGSSDVWVSAPITVVP